MHFSIWTNFFPNVVNNDKISSWNSDIHTRSTFNEYEWREKRKEILWKSGEQMCEKTKSSNEARRQEIWEILWIYRTWSAQKKNYQRILARCLDVFTLELKFLKILSLSHWQCQLTSWRNYIETRIHMFTKFSESRLRYLTPSTNTFSFSSSVIIINSHS